VERGKERSGADGVRAFRDVLDAARHAKAMERLQAHGLQDQEVKRAEK
jgi:hypothetical protein